MRPDALQDEMFVCASVVAAPLDGLSVRCRAGVGGRRFTAERDGQGLGRDFADAQNSF